MRQFLLLLFFSVPFLGQQGTAQKNTSNFPVVTIWVDGICGMCQDRIEKAAVEVPGVHSAKWAIDARQLSVTVNPEIFNEEDLHWAMASEGHDTNKWNALETAYENLHACCKYRDPEVIDNHQPEKLTGEISEYTENDQISPLIGANVFWLNSGEGTSTDEAGHFELNKVSETDFLVISYVGFKNDTINVAGQYEIKILLRPSITLDQIDVKYRRKSTEISFVDPMKIQQISEKELLKAACCNLSESFETNPSVDVSFTDAVTGTRQIEMLGLAGPYVQITRENMPDVRGLSSIYGLTYTPGPWIESIQLAKGPSSVINGYEAMTGQINVELKKPETGDRLFLNFYGNQGGRIEGNLSWRYSSKNWHTGVLLHGNVRRAKNDRNGDGFLDNPLGEQWIAVNRWKFIGQNGWKAQIGFKGIFLDQLSGQVAYAGQKDIAAAWGAEIKTSRIEGWAKIGKVFPERPYSSMGFQISGSYHDQDALFGARNYDAKQQSVYANAIYQGIFMSTAHEFKTGLSFQWDQFDEQLESMDFDRVETVPGAFFEYTFKPSENVTGVGGVRADYHSVFGLFFTPRLHLRWAMSDQTVLRASAGKGQRTASIISENIGALASARKLFFLTENFDHPYGLDQEVSWNFGFNLTQAILLGEKEVQVGLDAYHTRFLNQIVVDYDANPQALVFYNLNGKSYSNSLQVQVDYELLPRWDMRLAYRFNDVRTDYEQGRLEKPLVARHRAFVNTGYETKDGWKFDLTVNWQGPKRIPFTDFNPDEFQLEERSPDFFLTNLQVSKTWKDRIEVYAGGENIFDYVQENPILSNDDPFGKHFDSSLIWGPVFGRMIYTGLRYRLQ